MRLTPKELLCILETFQKHFGKNDHLWLFGSRVDDTKRGGDIDLYIETTETSVDRVYHSKIQFVTELWAQIGEQKIDIIINMLSNPTVLPIYKIAKETGVLLV